MKLVRNAPKVLGALVDLPGKPVVAKENLIIELPVRFREVDLVQIGSESYAYGLFAIILEDGSYGLCNVNAYFELGPSIIEVVKREDGEYYNFLFKKGQVVFRTKDLVCRSSLIYKAIEEFVFKGKIPWYVEYEDMGKIFSTAEKHARTSAKIIPSVVEFMAAYVARDKADRTKFIREVAKDPAGFKRQNLSWVPMRSVYWSAPGTVNKLAGAYFQDGVVSALVNPSKRVENIEGILRA